MITRLVYYSQNHIDPASGSVVRELGRILSASNRNNKPRGISGALIFDNQWFLQMLEGDRAKVWQTFERIRQDERHSDVTVVEVLEAPSRMFANWWMGIATRNEETSAIFSSFTDGGLIDPRKMSAANIVALMAKIADLGLSRQRVSTTTPNAPAVIKHEGELSAAV